MRRRAKIEEENHRERWLVSYADFMTLLFALFVVLFASAYHDRRTVQRVSAAVKNGFQEMSAFSAGDGGAEGGAPGKSRLGDPLNPSASGGESLSQVSAQAGIDVVELNKKLYAALGKEIELQEVNMRMTPEGFVISLHELGFFDSGEATLTPGASDKIKKIAGVLTQYGLDMRVEGHSDDVPIHNASFNSNWELSTARATAVAMMLMNESGVDPKRMSIAGYAQYHPTASNSTPEGRKANRRVDIVVVSAYRHPIGKTDIP
jgi:chemotaxis protein MotB